MRCRRMSGPASSCEWVSIRLRGQLCHIQLRESNLYRQTVPRVLDKDNRLDCAWLTCTNIARTAIYPITIHSILALNAVLRCTMEDEVLGTLFDHPIISPRACSQASTHDQQLQVICRPSLHICRRRNSSPSHS